MNNSKLPTNKTFGYFFTSVFLILGFYFIYIFSYNLAYIIFGISIVFFGITQFKPNLLYYLNYYWYQIGRLLGKFISPLIIALIFFVIISPIAIYMKIIRRDYLRMKKSKIKSYWIDKKISRDVHEFFNKQY